MIKSTIDLIFVLQERYKKKMIIKERKRREKKEKGATPIFSIETSSCTSSKCSLSPPKQVGSLSFILIYFRMHKREKHLVFHYKHCEKELVERKQRQKTLEMNEKR